jgi:LmbE family N-acetylglucosaminyl deacetylase
MGMKKVLFIGSHCDDIELGCGGTIHKHKHDWEITAFTLCGTGVEGFPATGVQDLWKTSKKNLYELGVYNVIYDKFTIVQYDLHKQAIWNSLRRLNESLQPDIVFTHNHDESRDHQVVHAESIRNFEQATIYCYSPTITTDPGFVPNVFVPISKENLDAKQAAIDNYTIYKNKIYTQDYVVEAEAIVRGVIARSKYAEGFQLFRQMSL